MDAPLDQVRSFVKRLMRKIAALLNNVSRGRLSPDVVTITGLIAHLPIVWLIAHSYDHYGYSLLAGILLIIFGLFDTLDGELARLQGTASPRGMFLDSVTDRMKEVLIYGGIIATQADAISVDYRNYDIAFLVLITLVMGGSLLTSYINAWGEAVMSRAGIKASAMNKAFRGGLASFEIRMALLAFGLITNVLLFVVMLIGVLVIVTITGRIRKVFRELGRV